MQKLLKLLFHRVTVVLVALIVQIIVFAVVFDIFYEHFVLFYGFGILLSIAAVLWIINSESDPGYKIAWIIPIMAFPIFGLLVCALLCYLWRVSVLYYYLNTLRTGIFSSSEISALPIFKLNGQKRRFAPFES